MRRHVMCGVAALILAGCSQEPPKIEPGETIQVQVSDLSLPKPERPDAFKFDDIPVNASRTEIEKILTERGFELKSTARDIDYTRVYDGKRNKISLTAGKASIEGKGPNGAEVQAVFGSGYLMSISLRGDTNVNAADYNAKLDTQYGAGPGLQRYYCFTPDGVGKTMQARNACKDGIGLELLAWPCGGGGGLSTVGQANPMGDKVCRYGFGFEDSRNFNGYATDNAGPVIEALSKIMDEKFGPKQESQ